MNTKNVVVNNHGQLPQGERRILLRVDEAAVALGVSRAFIYQILARDPSLPVVRLGRAVRIPVAALQQWADAKQGAWTTVPDSLA